MSRTRVVALLATGTLVAGALAGCLNPSLPQALFSVSADQGEAPFTTSFNGTISFDPDGHIVAYRWDFGDGTYGSGPVASHEYTKNGEYLVRLTVTDDSGKSSEAVMSVRALNPAPTAEFTYSPRSTLPNGDCFVCRGEKVDFTATAVDDGYVVSYYWEFGPEGKVQPTTAEGKDVQDVEFLASGEYSVLLTVTDDDGDTGQFSLLVTVAGGDPCGGGTCIGDTCISPDDGCAPSNAGSCPAAGDCDASCSPGACPNAEDCEEGACR
jgi:hypothetical protein